MATKGSPIILGLDQLFIDIGEWLQSRKENFTASPFLAQSEHENFLVNQESVTLCQVSVHPQLHLLICHRFGDSFQEASLDDALFYQSLV